MKPNTKNNDPGYQMVPVSRLRAIADPFSDPPWDGVASLTIDGIKRAMADGFLRPDPYSGVRQAAPWTVEDHIARIAFLAKNGWTDAIDIDVGIPEMACYVDWPVTDGNHRFAAAIVRGDDHILSSIAGSCKYMRTLFGRLRRLAAVPVAAYSE